MKCTPIAGWYCIRISALCRVTAALSDKVFHPFEHFSIQNIIRTEMAQHKSAVEDIAKSLLLQDYSAHFLERLKTDENLKKKIGKQQWSIEVRDLVIRVDKNEVLHS